MWWVFFAKFQEVRGWRLGDMAAIYGTVAGAFGLAMVFGEGARGLARTILEGDLDGFLTQPKPPLLHCVASRSDASGWGDLVSAILLLGISGYLSPATLPLGLLGMACGAVVFLATTVLIQSIAFWVADSSDVARQLSEFVILFSLQPKPVFTGALKLLLYTAVPAGFISYLPVELVRGVSVPVLAAVVLAAVLYALLAAAAFRAGLRRYESGNRFGVRA
jgi:ABC-2 type transport system permease protein